MEKYTIAYSSVIGQLLFIKLLGLSFFFAFYSLSQQVIGLYGKNGISPISDLLDSVKPQVKQPHYLYIPTVFWIDSSDNMLKRSAQLGTILSILIILGFFPAPLILLCVLLYLSFTSVATEFLSFQWDALLIEVGFLGFLMAIQSPPPMMVIILAWFLLFRFFFSSGAVKILSRCPEWRSLRAMGIHFETQPLPNLGGYYAHELLKPFAKLITLAVYLLELVVPFLIFGGAFLRLICFILSLFLQLAIMATGNFAFFNLLTIALMMPLLDDSYLAWLGNLSVNALPPNIFLTSILNLAAAVLLIPNVLILLNLFTRIKGSERILQWFQHFQLVNSYGLFAVMTTERNEIILEGSNDGVNWKEYVFKYKPSALDEAPRQIAPLQPRLDWQMWFASLSSPQRNAWFYKLVVRLLQGSKDVLGLFRTDPFPDHPPREIRALFYEYHFNDLKDKKKTGHYWKRKYLGLYSPIFSLKADE